MTKTMNSNAGTVWVDIWGVPIRTVRIQPEYGTSNFSSLLGMASSAFTTAKEMFSGRTKATRAIKASAAYSNAA